MPQGVVAVGAGAQRRAAKARGMVVGPVGVGPVVAAEQEGAGVGVGLLRMPMRRGDSAGMLEWGGAEEPRYLDSI